MSKCQDAVVKGGVLIAHHIREGKHQYEVENVRFKKASEKAFVRYESFVNTKSMCVEAFCC